MLKELFLYQEIVPHYFAVWGYGISSQMVIDALRDIDADDEILVHINGPGGDATESFAIYNALAMHSAKVTTRIESLAASGHGIISQAGDVRQIMDLADFMMHSAWGCACGGPEEMEASVDRLRRANRKQSKVFAKRGNRDDYSELLKGETWMDATEMVAEGLADEVIDEFEFDGDDEMMVAIDRERYNKIWTKAPSRVWSRAVQPEQMFKSGKSASYLSKGMGISELGDSPGHLSPPENRVTGKVAKPPRNNPKSKAENAGVDPEVNELREAVENSELNELREEACRGL